MTTDLPEIQESDVVLLHRPSGELSFRASQDAHQLDDVVQYHGVAFVIKGVSGDNDDTVYRAYPPSLEALGDVEPFAIQLNPGDVVVLRAKRSMTSAEIQAMTEQAQAILPGFKIIAVDNSVDIGKFSTPTPDDQAAADAAAADAAS